MFGLSKKEIKKIVYDPENFNEDEDVTHVIWERFNFDSGEIEETAEIEISDGDGLEAVDKLCDKKKADGGWQGFAYVYEFNGTKKSIRPKDNHYPEE
ncbi:MAG: hypothetical protein Q4Q53_07380 [Methanocorpusculum sp.]|nr:hypothetical protein [Methanocorpusculum sp.]